VILQFFQLYFKYLTSQFVHNSNSTVTCAMLFSRCWKWKIS